MQEKTYSELWDELGQYSTGTTEAIEARRAIDNFLETFIVRGDYGGLTNEMGKLYSVKPKPDNFDERLQPIMDAMSQSLAQGQGNQVEKGEETSEISEKEALKRWLGDKNPQTVKRELAAEYKQKKNERDVLNAEWRAMIDPVVVKQFQPYAAMLKKAFNDFLKTDKGQEYITTIGGRFDETTVGNTTFIDNSRLVLDPTVKKDIYHKIDVFAITRTLKSLEPYKDKPEELLNQFFHQLSPQYRTKAVLEGSIPDPKLGYDLGKREREREKLEKKLFKRDEALQNIGGEIAEAEDEMKSLSSTISALSKYIKANTRTASQKATDTLHPQKETKANEQTASQKISEQKDIRQRTKAERAGSDPTLKTSQKSMLQKVVGSFTSLLHKERTEGKDKTPTKS